MQQIVMSKTASADPRWIALDAVQTARLSLGLRDRDIAVLRGLLTFLRAEEWSRSPAVFPSNKTLQERCGGMDERTLRRRLVRLCEVGLIARHQSPNRKRFALRNANGAIVDVYGFDLSPLRAALPRLLDLAAAAAAEEREVRLLRQILGDRLYHAALRGVDVTETRRLLRRKCKPETLREAIATIEAATDLVHLAPVATDKTTDGDGQIDRHNQTSIEDSEDKGAQQDLPLSDCIERLPSATSFRERRPSDWEEMDELARNLAPAIGLTPSEIAKSRDILGQRGTTLAVLGLVEAHGKIMRPKAYLAAILRQKTKGSQQLARMFYALTNRFPAGNRPALA